MKKLAMVVGGLMMTLVMAAGCGDDSENCTPNDHVSCLQGISYWMDSCGNQGLVAEVCDCGCNTDFSGCDESCTCTPDCANKECGDDGCGDSCGTCDTGEVCGTDFQCFSCTVDCTGKDCGDDGCGGSCGTCDQGETCSTAGICEAEATDQLVITNCNVPYVLDGAQVGDQAYLGSHFAHLIQQYCVTGDYDGVDIASYPEKMYYGQHSALPGTTVTFTQISMSLSPSLTPEWTVKLDFNPDSSFTNGSVWNAAVGGVSPPEVNVGLIKHLGGSNLCLEAIGTAGNVTVTDPVDCNLQEGGSYSISGVVQLTNPWDLSDYCSQTPANLPCCS